MIDRKIRLLTTIKKMNRRIAHPYLQAIWRFEQNDDFPPLNILKNLKFYGKIRFFFFSEEFS